MTREEIMAMPAGPDLDRLVAEAMGGVDGTRDFTCQHCFDDREGWNAFHDVFCCNTCGRTTPIRDLPCLEFSVEIHYAWKVWEAMCASSLYVMAEQSPRSAYVRFVYGDGEVPSMSCATADTVPLAICRAFLLLKEAGK